MGKNVIKNSLKTACPKKEYIIMIYDIHTTSWFNIQAHITKQKMFLNSVEHYKRITIDGYHDLNGAEYCH